MHTEGHPVVVPIKTTPDYFTLSCTSLGPSTLPKDHKREYQGRETNFLGDIMGSNPGRRTFCNKPSFLQTDVDGSQPKRLINVSDPRNKPDLTLCVDDIPGTRYAITDRMMKTMRSVNPLVPDYPLPSYVHTAQPETKFLRDNLNHSDIEGSHSKPLQQYSGAMKDTMNVSDIEGTHPGWKPMYQRRSEVRNIMNIEDIAFNKSRYLDRTNRVTNVLDPHYVINGIVLADGKGSKPKPLKKLIQDSHLLQTGDIPGATSGWKHVERTEVRNLCNTHDIEGAQADTIKHSIVTLRAEKESPLNPTYQLLDDGSPLFPLNKPLIPSGLVKMATLKPKLDPKADKPAAHQKGDSPFATSNTVAKPIINSHTFDSLALDFNKLALAGNNSISHSSSSSNFNTGTFSQSGGIGSSRPSPAISGRANASARAEKARLADIDAVRSLS